MAAARGPFLTFAVEENLLKRIDDCRDTNHFPTRTAALRWRLEWALKQKPEVPRDLMR